MRPLPGNLCLLTPFTRFAQPPTHLYLWPTTSLFSVSVSLVLVFVLDSTCKQNYTVSVFLFLTHFT